MAVTEEEVAPVDVLEEPDVDAAELLDDVEADAAVELVMELELVTPPVLPADEDDDALAAEEVVAELLVEEEAAPDALEATFSTPPGSHVPSSQWRLVPQSASELHTRAQRPSFWTSSSSQRTQAVSDDDAAPSASSARARADGQGHGRARDMRLRVSDPAVWWRRRTSLGNPLEQPRLAFSPAFPVRARP
ncbi:MAG: hypothetical protein AB2A00_27400 [Myxococcota bacterium]